MSSVGGTRLDLSQAQLAAPEVTLTKVSLVGGTRITVPPGIRVVTSGFSLVGGTRVDLNLFVEEMGKTVITTVEAPGNADISSKVAAGDVVVTMDADCTVS